MKAVGGISIRGGVGIQTHNGEFPGASRGSLSLLCRHTALY